MSAVYVGEDVMRSIERGHSAARTESGGWVLSWLPGRVVDRNQAITGMVLAELVAAELEPAEGAWPDFEVWVEANPDLALHVDGWAGELGLTGGFAASLVRLEHAAAVDAAAEAAADADVADRDDAAAVAEPVEVAEPAEASDIDGDGDRDVTVFDDGDGLP